MTPRRNGSDNGTPGFADETDETAIVAPALRLASDTPPRVPSRPKTDEERMSLFWRVFGGTILSICALVGITLFNNLSSTLSEMRRDIGQANEARAAAIAELRQEMAKAAEARADLVRKDEFATRLNSNWDRMSTLQQQNNTQNATLTSLKTEVDGVKERVTKQVTDTDAVRKDVAALESLKERVAGLVADLKANRDDAMKLRGEMDRNQAADMERKQSRDAQYKQIDDVLKELQKGVLECREKIARLEGSTAAPSKKEKSESQP